MQLSHFTVGADLSLKFELNLASDLQPGAFLSVRLPESVFYISKYSDVLCDKVQCRQVTTSEDSMGTFFTQINIDVQKAWAQGDSLSFTISGIRNKFDSSVVLASFVIQSLDS